MVYLTIAAMLVLVLWPALLPAGISTGHALRRRTAGPAPRPAAVPATG